MARGTKLNQRGSCSSAPSQSAPSLKEDTNDALERSKYVYELVNGWIENADNKVSVSCGIFTGAFGVFTFLAERYIGEPDNPVINVCWHRVYKCSFLLSLLVMALAVFFYAKAIIPNLRSSGNIKATQKKYPLFYGDIYSLKLEEYQQRMAEGNGKDLNDELVVESWHNAGISLRKMKWHKRGVVTSIIAIGLAALSFSAHFMMYR